MKETPKSMTTVDAKMCTIVEKMTAKKHSEII